VAGDLLGLKSRSSIHRRLEKRDFSGSLVQQFDLRKVYGLGLSVMRGKN